MIEKKKPLISIIIPIYNTEKYIDRCCESISNQSMPDFEVLLIDDGSKDKSPLLCQQWCEKDARFRYYRKENGGLGDSRNYGMRYAEGKYVTFCDSDDWIDTNCYKTISSIILQFEPDIIGFGYYNCFDGNPRDKVISHISEGLHRNIKETLLPDFISKEKIFSTDLHPVIKSACMHLYRFDLLKESAICFESERDVLNEDFLFNLQVISTFETYYCVHQPFYYYDTRSGSLTQRHIEKMYERKKNLLKKYRESLANSCLLNEINDKRMELFWIESMYSCISNACRRVSDLSAYSAIKETRQIYKDKNLRQYILSNPTCTDSKKGRILLKIMRMRNSVLTYLIYKYFVRK